MRSRSVYSYVVTHDYGFAPNPYAGFLSIAACKPRIRSSARSGDWVIGVGAVRTVGGDRLVYAVLIDEIVQLDVYGKEERFAIKRPLFRGEPWQRAGDNIYFKNDVGAWVQRRSSFHNISHMTRDLSGTNALLGREFYYFGSEAPGLPRHLITLAHPGRGHRRFEEPGLLHDLEDWLRTSFRPGVQGEPFRRNYLTAPNSGAAADTNRAVRGHRR